MFNLTARDHFANRYAIGLRKGPVALVVRGHSHNGPGPIAHQHVVGNPNGQQLVVHRIQRIAAGENPGLFLFEFLPLEIAFSGRRLAIRGDRGTAVGSRDDLH